MKILILHHLLWAHYKNAFYAHLYKKAVVQGDFEFKVLQVAVSESTRLNMHLGEIPYYPYTVLSNENLENVNKRQVFGQIVKEIKTYKPNVVNINGFFTWYHIATFIYCKLNGIKIVLSNDSTAGDNPTIWWKSLLKSLSVKLSDGYYCFGQKAEEYLLNLGGNAQKTISKRAAVVDNDWIKASFEQHLPQKQALKNEWGIETEYNFIYVGRFIEFKNLPFLVEAFSQINNNNWGLIFVGDGEEKLKIEKKITELNVKNIHFLGSKIWQEIPKFLTLGNVLVLPSKSEPWGLVLNEAMVCGLPIIVSDNCGSAIDLVEQGKNGFSFKNNNLAHLTKAMQYCVDNVDETKKMGQKAQFKINEYTMDLATKDFINGCKSLI